MQSADRLKVTIFTFSEWPPPTRRSVRSLATKRGISIRRQGAFRNRRRFFSPYTTPCARARPPNAVLPVPAPLEDIVNDRRAVPINHGYIPLGRALGPCVRQFSPPLSIRSPGWANERIREASSTAISGRIVSRGNTRGVRDVRTASRTPRRYR